MLCYEYMLFVHVFNGPMFLGSLSSSLIEKSEIMNDRVFPSNSYSECTTYFYRILLSCVLAGKL